MKLLSDFLMGTVAHAHIHGVGREKGGANINKRKFKRLRNLVCESRLAI